MKTRWILLLFLVLPLLPSACGGSDSADEPAPIEAPTKLPAQPTSTQPVMGSDVTSAAIYQHPSGAFSVALPFGSEYSESDYYTLFSDGASVIVAFFVPDVQDNALEENTTGVADSVLSAFLLETDLINDYLVFDDEPESVNDGYVIYFEYTSDQYGEAESDLYVAQEGQMVYGLALLAPDYGKVEDTWVETINSLTTYGGGNGAAENQPSEPQSSGEEAVAPTPSDDSGYVADLGFRPGVNGFGFENYGESPYQNLTPVEMRRIFGDQVCAYLEGDECILTPPAAQWMEQENNGMNGGHCYGFSVLSLRFFKDFASETEFGSSIAAGLSINGNEALQREIAYSFVHQGFDSVYYNQIQGTPSEILGYLINAIGDGSSVSELYTIGIFQIDGSGGHAVTPYAVKDRGDGIYDVMVYDNNWPNDSDRAIIVDTSRDIWTYQAAINPEATESLYMGNAESMSMSLLPLTPGLEQQPCAFCKGGSARGGAGLAAAAQQYNEIWLDGEGDLLIVDEEGRRYGYVDGEFVTEIPGVKSVSLMTGDLWADDREPVYYVPIGMDFMLTIDGSRLEHESLTDVILIGPGYDLGLEDIYLEPGQVDSVIISPEEGLLVYTTEGDESPNIVFGLERAGADYMFEIQGVDMTGGGELAAMLTIADGDLIINASKLQAEGQFSLWMTRIDDQGEMTFYNDEIYLAPGGLIYVYFEEWTGEGGGIGIGVDYDGDEELDEELWLEDEG